MPSSQLCVCAVESREEVRDDGFGGKTLYVNIASGDEGEVKPRKTGRRPKRSSRTRHKAQDTSWSKWRRTKKVRVKRKRVADDVMSEMRDVKCELLHVGELLGVQVRRERCAETTAEIAARRLDRMEREQDEVDDAKHETSLQKKSSRGQDQSREVGRRHVVRQQRLRLWKSPDRCLSRWRRVPSTKSLGTRGVEGGKGVEIFRLFVRLSLNSLASSRQSVGGRQTMPQN